MDCEPKRVIAGRYTAFGGVRPSSRTARSAETTSIPIASRVSRVALAMCGVRTTFSIARSSSLTAGSRSNTSSAAPAIEPAWSARHERGLVDHLPAGGVHENGRRLHRLECCGADEVAGLGSQRAVHGHDIGHRKQREEIVAAPGERGSRAVRGRKLRDPTADPPRPHDEHLLPFEALTDHEVRPPLPAVAAAQRAVAFADAPQERENQRDRVLGGRVRQDARRVADDDSALARGVEVDVVDPDRIVRDDAELRSGGVEERGVDRRRRE